MRGIPYTVKDKMIRDFFAPLKLNSICIPRNAKNAVTGIAFVEFNTKAEAETAMKRNGQYLGGRYMELFRMDK